MDAAPAPQPDYTMHDALAYLVAAVEQYLAAPIGNTSDALVRMCNVKDRVKGVLAAGVTGRGPSSNMESSHEDSTPQAPHGQTDSTTPASVGQRAAGGRLHGARPTDSARRSGAGSTETAHAEAVALLPRIDAAIQRIVNGGCMRIPANPEDPDLVLADCKSLLKHVYGVLASDAPKGDPRDDDAYFNGKDGWRNEQP